MDLVKLIEANAGKTPKEIAEAINKEFLPENFVSKEQYKKKTDKLAEVESELKTANEQLQSTSKTVEELQKTAGISEELKGKFEALQNEHNEYKTGAETRIANVQKSATLKETLLKSGAVPDAVDLLLEKFDLEKLTLKQDGSLDGFDSQFESMKTSRPTLFATEAVVPDPVPSIHQPAKTAVLSDSVYKTLGIDPAEMAKTYG